MSLFARFESPFVDLGGTSPNPRYFSDQLPNLEPLVVDRVVSATVGRTGRIKIMTPGLLAGVARWNVAIDKRGQGAVWLELEWPNGATIRITPNGQLSDKAAETAQLFLRQLRNFMQQL